MTQALGTFREAYDSDEELRRNWWTCCCAAWASIVNEGRDTIEWLPGAFMTFTIPMTRGHEIGATVIVFPIMQRVTFNSELHLFLWTLSHEGLLERVI